MPHKDCKGVSFGVIPRQTCPQPRGHRWSLFSKTRWFMGFCNSHPVSHFATFFIDKRAKISIAESLMHSVSIVVQGSFSKPNMAPSTQHSVPWCYTTLWVLLGHIPSVRRKRARAERWCWDHHTMAWMTYAQSIFLRVTAMILPLVHLRKPCYDFSFLQMIRFNGLLTTSRVVNRLHCRDLNTSPDNSIRRSDEWCVQRVGT
jgi:hypothetical protein